MANEKAGAAVKTYYEKNTQKFLFFQKGKALRNIHQALWVSENMSRWEAENYSNELIRQVADSILSSNSSEPLQIYDLGCGVGGVVHYLGQYLKKEAHITGFSISTEQIKLAKQQNEKFDVPLDCHFEVADFHALPTTLVPADLMYAIEAFVHAYDAQIFFQQVAKHLKPGGKLVLIDDFLDRSSSYNDQEKYWIKRFEYGWVLGSLYSVDKISEMAKQHGLVLREDQDLTPYLRIYTMKERFIRFYVNMMEPFLKNSEYFKSLIGGDARQYCLQKQIIKYRILTFERI